MQITLQELNMTYPNGKKALQGVSASLDSPSLIGLLGPNGAGKSTLMKLLVAGLLPTGGAIRADGEPLTKCERAYKARLGYLPQDFGLFDELTVEQFLDYMGALKGLRSGRESIRAVIGAVHLEEKRRARIRTLSGGQRQRVGIAQALLGDPAFLIFDEPTVGLDPEERIHFRNLFPGWPRTGWCSCPPTSSRMCSRCAPACWCSTRGGCASTARRRSLSGRQRATWAPLRRGRGVGRTACTSPPG